MVEHCIQVWDCKQILTLFVVQLPVRLSVLYGKLLHFDYKRFFNEFSMVGCNLMNAIESRYPTLNCHLVTDSSILLVIFESFLKGKSKAYPNCESVNMCTTHDCEQKISTTRSRFVFFFFHRSLQHSSNNCEYYNLCKIKRDRK